VDRPKRAPLGVSAALGVKRYQNVPASSAERPRCAVNAFAASMVGRVRVQKPSKAVTVALRRGQFMAAKHGRSDKIDAKQ